jgi:hypothetical protein
VVSVTPRLRFSPGERTPDTHWTGGWVGPRAGLDTEAREKILSPLPGKGLPVPIVQEAGWVHRAGLDTEAREKILSPLPGKGLPVPIVQEAGWVPEPVWTQRL